MSHSILLVEDDAGIFEPLLEYLAKHAFKVAHAPTLKAADAALASAKIEAVVLDWMLPDGDGVAWLKKLRLTDAHTPVIMLTARAELADKVVGLEVGANDYLTKPFEPRELVARISAQLRSLRVGREPAGPETLETSGIRMDLTAHEVTFAGATVTLTQMEFKLLRFFLENPRRALSREAILNEVWGLRYPSTRTVDVHVGQLRQKLKASLFETLHGTGYRFVPE